MNPNELLDRLMRGEGQLIFNDWLNRTQSTVPFVRQFFGFGA